MFCTLISFDKFIVTVTNTYVIAQFFRQIKRFTLENSCMTNLVIHEKEEKKISEKTKK